MIAPINFLAPLNPAQRRAVEHFCGPLLVVAGAGSGKTRALTYRIANLVLNHHIDPENILAVTFTNKAAREMKSRVETLFADQEARASQKKPLSALSEYEQTKLRSKVYKNITKNLWIGTFHSLCSRILRYDIEKYHHPQGYRWDRNFSIFDESDVQGLIKAIVVTEMNLDDRQFNPRTVRFAISNAKNQGFSPEELEREQSNYRGRVIADVYRRYQKALAENNSLDFDDLILMPVQLFQQNEQVLAYWHNRFHHILVDEYQDTNRTQYNLIRLLSTNGHPKKPESGWENRSIFVVGDADQSIYAFRCADFTILMNFQEDFGDRLPDHETSTMVKLEENYRSTANILEVANVLIEHNRERIDKVLRPTRGEGEAIVCHRCEDEVREAQFVTGQVRNLKAHHPELTWGSFAVLYRTNAQSRAIEEALTCYNIPYKVVGGLRFYDRREIKDILAYLRLVANPADSVSLKRVINVPRRAVGKSSIEKLEQAAQTLGDIPLWEIVQDETSVQTLLGRSAKGVLAFSRLIKGLRDRLEEERGSVLMQTLLEESGYLQSLKEEGTDEALERVANVQELYNAILQFEEENEDTSLQAFLSSASLASDLDDLEEEAQAVTLMTLHASKGLEFPVVFMVGMEQGLFPSFRSLEDPAALEEERRLCYVGITRAQERLFLSYVNARRLYGDRQPTTPSLFLGELPPEYVVGTSRRDRRKPPVTPSQRFDEPPRVPPQVWAVGDRLVHPKFGTGTVTHLLGTGLKACLAVEFPDQGRKILDPKLIRLRRVED